MTAIERLKEAIAYLKQQGRIEKQQDIVDKTGYNKTYVSGVLNGKTELSSKFVREFCTAFPEIMPDWVLAGEGDMLRSRTPKNTAVPADLPNLAYVPLVSVRARAGYLLGYGDLEFVDELPKIPVMVDREYRGEYQCFEVSGDSMDDGSRYSYFDGDIVLAREIGRQHWHNKLHIRDWDFVIVHREEGVIIKRIVEHNIETCQIKLHSLNDYYHDYEINLNDVLQLFNVVKIVERKMRR